MTALLDNPTVDPIILDETILADELPCHAGDAGASWRLTMRCCGHPVDVCDTHDALIREVIRRGGFWGRCGRCGHKFGFNPNYSDVYTRRIPI